MTQESCNITFELLLIADYYYLCSNTFYFNITLLRITFYAQINLKEIVISINQL